MTLDLTTCSCERCGCTETRTCPGGCAWDPDFVLEGRAVCTTCASRVRATEGPADA